MPMLLEAAAVNLARVLLLRPLQGYSEVTDCVGLGVRRFSGSHMLICVIVLLTRIDRDRD